MNFGGFGKSNNPMLNDKAIAKTVALEKERTGGEGPWMEASNKMTISGAVNKTVLLTILLLGVSLFSYSMPLRIFMPIGALGGAAVYMLTSFKPHLSPYTAPLYSILKGLFVGAVSYYYAAMHDGIIFQALSLTIGTLLAMLLVYKSGLIKVTQRFRMIVGMAVGAIMITYLISWIGSLTGGFEVPFIHDATPIGIGISVVIIGVASLYLLMNFDNFEKGEQMGAPKHMEWYFGMGLMFTIVWLYVEFLRLLSKIQRR